MSFPHATMSDPKHDPHSDILDDEKHDVDHIERISVVDSESSNPHFVSEKDNKRVLRLVDLNMMPIFCSVVALMFLDKTALTYTSIMGIQKSTGMKGDNYAMLGTIFSIGYLVGQYPMCFLQQRLPLSKLTSFNIIAWGTCVAAMAACDNFQGLLACRFFLGFFESSLSPALLLFTAQYYRKNEQGTRTGIWMSFTTWGGILGAGIAYGLLRGDMAIPTTLPMRAWRLLFLIFGVLTIFLGIVFGLLVPDTPDKAWFLKGGDKEIAVRRTAENFEHLGEKKWKWYQFREAFTDPQVLMMCLVGVLTSIPNGGITNFYALMVLGIGVDPPTTILLSMLNCWVSVVVILAMFFGDKLRCRTLTTAFPHIISMIGGILVWKLPHKLKKARLASFYLCLVYAIAMIGCMSLIASNVKGRTKKTTTAAMFFIATCVGQLIGPQTFRYKDAPHYSPALITITVCNICVIITMICLFFYLKRENKRRDRLAADVASTPDAAALAAYLANQEDLTDRENLHVRYVL